MAQGGLSKDWHRTMAEIDGQFKSDISMIIDKSSKPTDETISILYLKYVDVCSTLLFLL